MESSYSLKKKINHIIFIKEIDNKRNQFELNLLIIIINILLLYIYLAYKLFYLYDQGRSGFIFAFPYIYN